MRILISAIVLSLVFAGPIHAADPKTESAAEIKQITALEEAWVTAAQKSKADAIGEMLADDFTMTTPSGHLSPKDEFVSQFRDGIVVIETAKLEDMDVRVYGNAAVATGMLTIKGHAQDQDLSGSYRFTDTFVKRDGKWLKVAAQFTGIR
ncbi:MAG TPA: nuclear transport factor 2 family protein [Humisphaera sp.]|jgi:ketosteroid isomerase-like protein|nr:nuclear transport factor 2 family protein [Humisphaera sp.]